MSAHRAAVQAHARDGGTDYPPAPRLSPEHRCTRQRRGSVALNEAQAQAWAPARATNRTRFNTRAAERHSLPRSTSFGRNVTRH